jgi:hypothetical protein
VIELPRALARDFRAVLRRCTADGLPRGPLPAVLCRAGPGGRSLFAVLDGLAVCHHQEGDCPAAELAFDGAVLAHFEGSTAQPVTLEEISPGRGRACWQDGGAARSAEFPTVAADGVVPFPERPATMTPLPDEFGTALGEAALTTAEVNTARRALTRVQLGGRRGEVVATDGRQLLVQADFDLPWEDEVLVPHVPAFAGRLLAGARPVAVGRTPSHVVIQAGPWAFALAIDADARYPDARGVIPRPDARSTRLRLDPADAALLLRALPRLPGHDEHLRPITLDLGPRPAVRAGAGEAVEEIALTRSAVTGPPLRLVTDRRYLRRALRLGFAEVETGPGGRPLVCRAGTRTYLWMALGDAEALPPSEDSRAVVPLDPSTPATHPALPRRSPLMPRPVPPSDDASDGGNVPVVSSVSRTAEATVEETLAEGEALRGLLQEVQLRLARLLAGLTQQRRPASVAETALAPRRPLRRIGGGAP